VTARAPDLAKIDSKDSLLIHVSFGVVNSQ